jgi:Na+-driven multidrug efflux pump
MGQGDFKKAQKQGYAFLVMGAIIGVFASLLILVVKNPIIQFYDVSAEAKAIADKLMYSIMIIMVFQSVNSILTKGVLRAGGDTKFLMVGDVLFLWLASVPLGAFTGLVLGLDPFWVYFFLKIDQIIKCIWCYFRLRSGKWLKKINKAT